MVSQRYKGSWELDNTNFTPGTGGTAIPGTGPVPMTAPAAPGTGAPTATGAPSGGVVPLTYEQMQGLYENLFGTKGDEAGIQYWMEQSAAGKTPWRIAEEMAAAGGVSDTGYGYLLGDADYAPYLNNALLDKDQIEASRILKQSQLEAQQQMQGGIFNTQREDTAQQVNDNFEARGMFRSGGRHMKQAKERGRIDQMQGAYDLGVTGQINENNLTAQTQLSDVGQGIATEGTRALKAGTQKSYDEALNA